MIGYSCISTTTARMSLFCTQSIPEHTRICIGTDRMAIAVITDRLVDSMLSGLRRRFGRKAVVSYDRRNAYDRCIRNIMRIHRMVIVKSGEEREKGLEDAVISRMAIEGFCDRLEYCPDCFSKAAMAIDYIANFHPFVEGNKRTSLQLALCFLKMEGYELDDTEETYRFIRDVAAGKYDREEVEDWLRRHAHVSNP